MKIIILQYFCLLLVKVSETQECRSGRFGHLCQFKCHCTGDNCLHSGQCRSGSKCVPGWFGVACQYEDISYNVGDVTTVPSLNSKLAKDDSDVTCTGNITVLTYKWSESVPFTWLRVTVKERGFIPRFKLDFLSEKGQHLQCTQQRHFRVNERTVDAYCTMTSPVQAVHVYLDVGTEICSFHVSGETSCPEGKHGSDCNDTCDCPVKCETSYNRSFGCPECPQGFEGYMCDQISQVHLHWKEFLYVAVIAGLSAAVVVLLVILVNHCRSRSKRKSPSLDASLPSARNNQYETTRTTPTEDAGRKISQDSLEYINISQAARQFKSSERLMSNKVESYLEPEVIATLKKPAPAPVSEKVENDDDLYEEVSL